MTLGILFRIRLNFVKVSAKTRNRYAAGDPLGKRVYKASYSLAFSLAVLSARPAELKMLAKLFIFAVVATPSLQSQIVGGAGTVSKVSGTTLH